MSDRDTPQSPGPDAAHGGRDEMSATGIGPSPLRVSAQATGASDWEATWSDELEEIRHTRQKRAGAGSPDFDGETANERAHDARLAGFAVSGGGIRSATFNLGVMQALARLKLLSRFDYLSVNSGGGYIGGWLLAWIKRAGMARVQAELCGEACEDAGGPTTRPGPGGGGGGGAPGAGEPAALTEEGSPAAGQEVEAGPIRWLREFSNYLTPQVGIFTADTWTLVATYLRNLFLNFGIVVLLLGVILLSPRLLLLFSRWFERDDAYYLIATAVGFLTIAIVFIGLNLAEIFPEERRKWPWFARQGWVQALVVLPLFAAAWFAALWLWHSEAGALAEEGESVMGYRDLLLGRWLGEKFGWYDAMGLATVPFEPVAWALAAAVLYFGVWLVGAVLFVVAGKVRKEKEPPWSVRVWRAVLFSAPIAGAFGGAMIWGLTVISNALEGILYPGDVVGGWHLLHINVWKAPAIVLVFVLTAFVHTGLMGRAFPESMRQWWSRLGAWMLIYSVTWLGVFWMAIYGPIVLALAGQMAFAALTATWAGATTAGVVVGRETAKREGNQQAVPRWRKVVAALAPQLFIVGLLAIVALGLHLILSPPGPLESAGPAATSAAGTTSAAGAAAATDAAGATGAEGEAYYRTTAGAVDTTPDQLSAGCGFFWSEEEPVPGQRRSIDAGRVIRCHSERLWEGTTPKKTLWLLGLLTVGAVLLSWRVDINEFSMHLFYRNRLIRAYLGASNDDRQGQPFTGFDAGDDLAFASLTAAEGYDGPYPLSNITLNLVSGEELAWQERKGASFVFTPRATGWNVYRGRETRALDKDGFRPTNRYLQTADGVTLGTAMAISGAAASPNMGAGTTPAMAFLLTVFNVRLGWWLGNPRHKKTWNRMGPHVGAAALLAELFGSTDETSRYVYLSDGGHFENLAVYELVRRRCRFIVASDAGTDPKSWFDDLGNAIRKCTTDFGIDIDIDTARLAKEVETSRSAWHCAVGAIRYDKVDPGATPGVFLYIKASLTGDEPRDVLTYGLDKTDFPHESTADQFFGEAQFESYRKLGEHVALTVFARIDDAPEELSQEQLLVRMQEAWFPPSGAPEGAFTRHAQELDELLDRLRTDPHLHFLIPQIYPEWPTLASEVSAESLPEEHLWLPGTYEELVSGFFFCHSLIQLMENTYLDLGLETDHGHPDNRGWMNLFKHWAWAGMVGATWTVTASTFGARFQNFCRRRLGLRTGALECLERPLAAGQVEATLAALRQDGTINFLEAELVEDFARRNPGLVDRLFVFRLTARDPTAIGSGKSSKLAFTCGIALAHGDELLYLRIQDHLRRMGLGRRALDLLVREHGVREVRRLTLAQMPRWAQDRPGEAELGLLHTLFRSVEQEAKRG